MFNLQLLDGCTGTIMDFQGGYEIQENDVLSWPLEEYDSFSLSAIVDNPQCPYELVLTNSDYSESIWSLNTKDLSDIYFDALITTDNVNFNTKGVTVDTNNLQKLTLITYNSLGTIAQGSVERNFEI